MRLLFADPAEHSESLQRHPGAFRVDLHPPPFGRGAFRPNSVDLTELRDDDEEDPEVGSNE